MAVERSRVGCTYAVPGQDWIRAGERGDQEAYWQTLRNRFHDDLQRGGWQLCEDPRETTEYDEEHRQVFLHIRAVAERESREPIDYGARGGQPFGYA